jgi:hypothetical protein
MISIEQIEERFRLLPPDQLDIIIELRNLVAAIAPEAAETVRRDGLVYFHAGRGGPVSAGICQIWIRPGHVRLAFNHGAYLPDPRGLLVNEGRRVKRYVPIAGYDTAPWDDLRALIEASNRFDPRTL